MSQELIEIIRAEDMSNQVVKVRRETIAACMTCPLCHKLFRDATTICECLHTFCRNCIYKKLQDEETECCPICNIDLGCVSVEKLRVDHNMQNVRAKIFPHKRQKVKAPEIVLSVTLPVRRQERSLSSLVVRTPRVSTHTGMSRRRSKSIERMSLRGSSFSIEKPIKNEKDSIEDQAEISSSPERLNKITQNIKLSSSNAEPSSHPTPDKGTENSSKQWEGKADLWKPLTCLVEAANGSKSSRTISQGSVKSEYKHIANSEGHTRKVKEHGHKINFQDKKNKNDQAPESESPKKSRRIPKKASDFGDLGVSPQDVLDATTAICERRSNPIWFSLVASANQEGEAPLAQISASYLRIKDGSIPVSFIQKYLMRKLDLKSEDEVEIRCMGQSIVPTLQLNNLVDLWLQMTTPERLSHQPRIL